MSYLIPDIFFRRPCHLRRNGGGGAVKVYLPGGTTRLLSLYKPTGKPEFEKDDTLRAIFITCALLRAEK